MAGVPTYTYDDFLNTDRPYKFAYSFAENGFELAKVIEQLSKQGKAVGFNKFKTFFKEYCANIKKSKNEIANGNVTNFDGQKLELETGTWHTDEGGIYGYNPLTMLEMQICPHPLMPVMRLVNVDTNNEKIQIAYKKGGHWRNVVVEKNLIASANKIVALSDCGIAVTSENAKSIVRYLSDVENLNYSRLPEKACVGRCGWIGNHGFAPYIDGLVFDGEESYKKIFNAIKQKGDFDKWKEIAKEGRQTLQVRLLLAASFASVLVQPLSCLPFFVHLWSSVSGTGKTIALMLATSVWANPTPSEYMATFDSTGVGQELTAGFLNSLPLVLDELQLVKDKKNFDKTIYQLAEGVGRTRGSKTGGLQHTKTWGNTIITSGEMPMTTFSNGAGAINRIIELNCNEKLFQDGNGSANALKNNYGMVGKMFVEWLEESDHVEEARKMFNCYMRAFQDTDVTDKQIMAASLILTADELISGLFFNDAPLSIDDVVEFLKTKAELDINAKALEYLLSVIAINQNKFDDNEENKGSRWGIMDDKYIYISHTQFKNICADAGYSPDGLKQWLRQQKFIEVDKDGRMVLGKKVDRMNMPCVWLVREKVENCTEHAGELDEDNPFAEQKPTPVNICLP